MSWLRANWRHIGLLIVLTLTVTGWVQAAKWMGVADTEQATGERQTLNIMHQRSVIAQAEARSLALEDSLAELRTADSLRVEDLEELSDSLEVVSDSLEALGEAAIDSTGVVPAEVFRDYVASTNRELAVADSLRNVERQGRLRAEANECAGCPMRITELQRATVLLEERDETRLREIQALRNAVAPSFTLKIKENWYLVVAGMAIGYVVAGR